MACPYKIISRLPFFRTSMDNSLNPSLENGENGASDSEVIAERQRKMIQVVNSIVMQAKSLGANSLDLSRKKLSSVPETLLELSNLEVRTRTYAILA